MTTELQRQQGTEIQSTKTRTPLKIQTDFIIRKYCDEGGHFTQMEVLQVLCGCKYSNRMIIYCVSQRLIINKRYIYHNGILFSIFVRFYLVYCVSFIYSSHAYCHMCDSKQYLPCNFSFTLSITQTVVSPLGAVPHLQSPCLKSVVSSLSPLLCKACSPPLHLYFICHIFYVASIHSATFCKQTISPVAPSPQALFFSLSLSTVCHLLL